MRVAILGATRGMGRALARRMAARGDTLALLGRHADDLERSRSDLSSRGASQVTTALCDLRQVSSFGPALDQAADTMGGLDAVVVTAGVFAPQDVLAADLDRTVDLLTVDFAHTVAFCEAARHRLLARGGGVLCVFSSVAGDRGRTPVALYGAAKAGLSRYLEALDHAHRREGLVTVTVKPGFVRTDMTEGLPEPPFAGNPDDVARVVLRAMDRGRPVVYAPPIWRWIMLVIRWLPRMVMRRLRF